VVLRLRRLASDQPLEDAPAEIVALLASVAELTLTHARRRKSRWR
jgi:hypothetical protein